MKTTTQKIALLIAVYTLLFTTNINAQAGSTCGNPLTVTNLPFNDAGNTSTFGDNYNSSDVPTVASGAVTNGTGSSDYLNGDDVVYAYTPTCDQEITIATTNDNSWIGLWAFEGCPFSSTVGYHTSTSGTTREISNLAVTAGQTYYFVVSTWPSPQSTDYTISITENTSCPVPPECNDLSVNTTLFSQSGLTTCGSGDDFSSSDACGSSYMGGEDFVIEYTPNTTECIDIALTNTNTWTGVFLTDECPSSSSATCLGEATNSSGNPTLSGMNVTAGQTYYITVSTYPLPDCTPFDIDITACPPPVIGQDCPGAEMVCSNTSFAGNSSGFGTQELNASNQGCLSSGERESSWYYVNIGSNGTLEMTISPVASDDYDWAIWGPFSSTNASTNCPPTSDPIRCSYAGGDGDTGMGNGATDFSEGAGGDKWIAPLNVVDDEIYILLITNHSTSSQPFNLNWGGTAGLDCTPISLPVELTFFTGNKTGNINHLSWETATETNNDYFILEHSVDGFAWSEITKMNGAGNSTEINNYSFDHRDFPKTINYYRLTQVDFDGKRETFEIVSIDNSSDRKLIKTVNMIGQEVNENYKGVVIDYYDDNTVVKRYQK